MTGCGGDELSDDAYGSIDLAPYYGDGATAADPLRGLPRNITPTPGWQKGLRNEAYDFGLVAHVRRRSAAGATLFEPDVAPVNPMYFFFDSGRRPMFSRPVYDRRTGLWHMRGGKGVLDPNPVPAPQETEKKANYFKVPYSVRVRTFLKDGARGNSADYQRPIINVLHDQTAKYTGLWEVVEVIAQDGSYEPDSIKSFNTLKAAVDAGKLVLHKTGKVINCPVLDDRTYVTPSPMEYGYPKPRIELWYRTKLGSCYLADGWETLGETNGKAKDGQVRLFSAATLNEGAAGCVKRADGIWSDACWSGPDADKRLDTFDVIRYSIGDMRSPVTTVVVPIGKVFTPKVAISNMAPPFINANNIRYQGDNITTSQPRHTREDPPGYTPIVWLWDINVPQDPPYIPSSYKSLEEVTTQVTARDSGTAVWTKNYPVIGLAKPCNRPKHPDNVNCEDLDLECNLTPGSPELVTNDWGGPVALFDAIIQFEGGPRCDVKKVGYGGYCAPGIARCAVQEMDGDPNVAILRNVSAGSGTVTETKDGKTDIKAVPAGSSTSLFSGLLPGLDKAVLDAQKALDMANALPPTDMTRDMKIADAQKKLDTAKTNQALGAVIKDIYGDWGYTTDISGYGYACHPPTGGYCHMRCDAKATKTDRKEKKPLPNTPDPNNPKVDQSHEFVGDAKCGAPLMVGFECVGGGRDKLKVCLRQCSLRDTDLKNRAVCAMPFNEPVTLSDGREAEKLPGMECQNIGGATACAWNPDFEPRDESVWPRE